MKRAYFPAFLLFFSFGIIFASNVEISGTVVETDSEQPLKDVTISLSETPDISTITDSEGYFSLFKLNTSFDHKKSKSLPLIFGLKGKNLVFYTGSEKISGNISIFSGNGSLLGSINFIDLVPDKQRLTLPDLANGFNLLRIAVNNNVYTCTAVRMGHKLYMTRSDISVKSDFRLNKSTSDTVIDTLIAKKDGYVDKKVPVESYLLSDMRISMDKITPDVCDASTLKEAGACGNRNILIGTAVSSRNLSSLAANEFNYVTAENEMKWQNLQPSEGGFNFYQADAIVNWAKQNNIKVKGHCLVWHSQLAGWVNQAKGRDRVLGIMKNHIEEVMGHFGNDIYAWDVVNEAIATDSDVGEGNARMRNTVFYNEIGSDYIELAFRIARDYADSHNMKDMKLYYNDYSIDADNDKSRFARQMIKELVEKDVPIDGVGFQMHIGPPNNIPTVEMVEDNMRYYADLGLEVLISEWDINLCGNQVTEMQQLQLYHDITKLCVNQPKCVAITFWGINDSESWLNTWSTAMCNGGNSRSLLFNNNQKKDTYYQVLDALNGK